MELGVFIVGLGLAFFAGLQLRRTKPRHAIVAAISDAADGVPDAVMEDSDDVGHSVLDGSVVIRHAASRPTTHGGRIARGSVPPPFARTAAGEFVVHAAKLEPRSTEPTRPSVDDGWDDSHLS